ncbi:hypothetical protein ENUP19_0040G0027 [Entamoeba nuttalli]|uniref:Uncharacterized protein n=1 Tax=Entamoeba nuttalli TaxID=412467 RepID=A0ABQ0D9X9_9EUKA
MLCSSTRIYPSGSLSFSSTKKIDKKQYNLYKLIELGIGWTCYVMIDEVGQETYHTNYCFGFNTMIHIYNSRNELIGIIRRTGHSYKVYSRQFHLYTIYVQHHTNMVVRTINTSGREGKDLLISKQPELFKPCYPSSKNLQLSSPQNSL